MTPVQRTVTATVVALLLMVGFTIALVPLYNAFCQLTGLNGTATSRVQELAGETPDISRTVTVQFVTRTASGLPWRLEPRQSQIRVHPGGAYRVEFAFTNFGRHAYRGRAVPSVSPGEASLYLHKVTCFCFSEQRLEAGEHLALPVVFRLSTALPADVHTVTLAYTLYPAAAPAVHAAL